MAENADETKPNNIGLTDEVGQVALDKQVDALKRELKQFTDGVETVRKQRERYKLMCALDEEIWQMRLDPEQARKKEEHRVFVYEDNPRFWEIVLQKAKFQYEEDKTRMEGTLKMFDAQEKEQLAQVESSTKKLAELGVQ